jgi:hypothetical protein
MSEDVTSAGDFEKDAPSWPRHRCVFAARKVYKSLEIRSDFDLYLFLTSGHNTASIELPRAPRSRHLSADVCLRHAGHGRPAQPMKQGVLEP